MEELNIKKAIIVLINKTTEEWNLETKIPIKGCPCVEWTSNGVARLKIGDGINVYKDLDYFPKEKLIMEDTGSPILPVYFKDGELKVCAYTLGTMCKESASDYEKAEVINEKLNTMNSIISTNSDDITALFDEKNIMGSRLTKAETDIDSLQGDVKNNISSIKTLKEQNQDFVRDIGGNTAAIEILNKDVAEAVREIYGNINTVNNKTVVLQDNVNVLIDEKNLMGSRLTKAETNIVNLQNDVSNLQTDVADLNDEKNLMGSRLTKAETNIVNLQTNVSNLQTDVADLNDEKNIMGSRLTKAENTLNSVKTTAETAETKATEALARNIFTDEEKAKLAGITNPIIIKGRVDTIANLPTEAEIGWFYFVGLESASSYEEYCYSETGWEYVGLSQDGIDLSNYYTKAQVDSKDQTLIGDIQGNAAAIKILHKDVGDSVAGIYSEINSVKNTISPLQDNVSALIDEKNIMGSRLTKAETNIVNLQTNVGNLQTNVNDLIDEKNTMGMKLIKAETSLGNLQTNVGNLQTSVSTNTTDIADLKTKDQTIIGYIQTNTSMINLNSTDIENLQTDVSTLIDEKNLMGSRLTKAETNIVNLNSTVTETKTLAETNESNINSLKNAAYSISVSGKSTSAAISYSGVPTLICLTPNTADSTAGGLYMINSAGAVVKPIEKSGVVITADATSKTFTITNNTATVMDVCVMLFFGR